MLLGIANKKIRRNPSIFRPVTLGSDYLKLCKVPVVPTLTRQSKLQTIFSPSTLIETIHFRGEIVLFSPQVEGEKNDVQTWDEDLQRQENLCEHYTCPEYSLLTIENIVTGTQRWAKFQLQSYSDT